MNQYDQNQPQGGTYIYMLPSCLIDSFKFWLENLRLIWIFIEFAVAVSYPATSSPYAAPPPAGYPTKDGANPPAGAGGPVETKSRGDGFWKGCCAALCCCCVLDACFWSFMIIPLNLSYDDHIVFSSSYIYIYIFLKF